LKPPVEIEIKLPVESAASARRLLRKHGFRVTAPRVFEQNIVLDDERASLRARGLLLRVRGAGKTITCTFKSPEEQGRHKRREELEFQVSSLDACLAVFGKLGYRESFRYEKYRTEFGHDNEPGHVTLDETPIGVFMELEGPATWIDQTAKLLGFSEDSWLTRSYATMYFEWCEKTGTKPSNMRF
jgi:adenylate cyclase class 2